MGCFIIKDIEFYFDVENNEACIYRIDHSKKGLKEIIIPDSVQCNGSIYPVTGIRGGRVTRTVNKREPVTDKRKKNYGEYVTVGTYQTEVVKNVLGGEWENEQQIEKVILPKTLKKIGDQTFHCLKELSKINIPEGVESIGSWAFYGCKSLKSITIPSTVKEIGKHCFSGTPEMVIKVKNKPGTVNFGQGAVGSDDRVEYVGESKSIFAKLFKK